MDDLNGEVRVHHNGYHDEMPSSKIIIHIQRP